MLTMANNMAYSATVPTHLGAGFRTPRASANALTRSAFFTSVVYGRLYGGSSERRPRSGSSNSVQSATLLFRTNGGSSLNLNEDTTMSNDIFDIPLCLSEPQMDALSFTLPNLLEADLSQFTNGNELIAMHDRKAFEQLILAISVFGGVQ